MGVWEGVGVGGCGRWPRTRSCSVVGVHPRLWIKGSLIQAVIVVALPVSSEVAPVSSVEGYTLLQGWLYALCPTWKPGLKQKQTQSVKPHPEEIVASPMGASRGRVGFRTSSLFQGEKKKRHLVSACVGLEALPLGS